LGGLGGGKERGKDQIIPIIAEGVMLVKVGGGEVWELNQRGGGFVEQPGRSPGKGPVFPENGGEARKENFL